MSAKNNLVIKICGVTNATIATEIVQAGAQWIGMMMYPSSVRYVQQDAAVRIAQAVRATGGQPVAVFVDATANTMHTVCTALGVECVQLHGAKARAEARYLPQHWQRIYAMPVNAQGELLADAANGLPFLDKQRDFLLFDGEIAGSGQAFNWQAFKERNKAHLLQGVAGFDGFRYLLAGGLDVNNVADAITMLQPTGVDVSSGVEDQPGHKDIKRVIQFIQAVRGVQS